MIELKIFLCLTARRFEMSTAYGGLVAKVNLKGKAVTVDGERAYQVSKGEPSSFLPCRVRAMRCKCVIALRIEGGRPITRYRQILNMAAVGLGIRRQTTISLCGAIRNGLGSICRLQESIPRTVGNETWS